MLTQSLEDDQGVALKNKISNSHIMSEKGASLKSFSLLNL